MPGCVLRISSSEVAWPAELKATRTRNGGYICNVSEADGGAFIAQVADAEAFLSKYGDALAANSKSPGFTAELDFGVWNNAPDAVSQSFMFPPSLLALASACTVALKVSFYLCNVSE